MVLGFDKDTIKRISSKWDQQYYEDSNSDHRSNKSRSWMNGLAKKDRKKRALKQQKELDPAPSSRTFVMAVLLNVPWANG